MLIFQANLDIFCEFLPGRTKTRKKTCIVFFKCLQIDGLDQKGFADAVKTWNMKSPVTGNDVSEPVEFNLMFAVSIGPTGLIRG